MARFLDGFTKKVRELDQLFKRHAVAVEAADRPVIKTTVKEMWQEARDLERLLERLEKEKKESDNGRIRAEKTKARFQQSCRQKEREHSEAILKLDKERREKIADIKKSHREEIARLKSEHAQEMAKLEAQKKKSDAFAVKLEKEMSELEANIDKVRDKLPDELWIHLIPMAGKPLNPLQMMTRLHRFKRN